VLMLIFVGVWIWAWLPAHRATFDRLARIPMHDEAERSEP
jgi:cytochrome c oxidase cbb3-type subunit IV